ncbi:acyl-CoA dehydrogenase family protein [Nocardia sp. BMG111209]|uniref:acyl-CoA dehydrogenase family protein n=1 Tax=Nocardia sp. BMG111209 TaxID=1160137 RepID=UPI000371976F|nr:acyl-CoA dehydrogenase family protein [Nocardia sp. BMG111209]
MQLTFDAEVEEFRAEFAAFLDEYAPAATETRERSRSSSHVPDWARHWQRRQFDHGWLVPGNPHGFGGRNATVLQQYVHREELARRRIIQSYNEQGIGIIAASLLTFGTEEQKQRWAVPILRADRTASLGMSEPEAGSDLASLRTRAVRDGDEYVVTGQKIWTSGAHDADVLLTFVRTDPDAPKHRGISVLLIPTDTPGITRRPFASLCAIDEFDFNAVFFDNVRVPAANLIGAENDGWRVANGSLGHERTMLWMTYADQMQQLVEEFTPTTRSEQDGFATLAMDLQALRLLGSRTLAAAARGKEDAASMSILKLLGSEGMQRASEHALTARETDGLLSGFTGPLSPLNKDDFIDSWFNRYARTFAGTIAGGTSEIQRDIIAHRILGLPRR